MATHIADQRRRALSECLLNSKLPVINIEWIQIHSNGLETGTCNRQVLHSRDFPDSESGFLDQASDWHVARSDPNRPEKNFPIVNHFSFHFNLESFLVTGLVNTQPEVLQLLSASNLQQQKITVPNNWKTIGRLLVMRKGKGSKSTFSSSESCRIFNSYFYQISKCQTSSIESSIFQICWTTWKRRRIVFWPSLQESKAV